MDIEITVWAVNATTPSEIPDEIKLNAIQAFDGSMHERKLFDPAVGKSLAAKEVKRNEMGVDQCIEGPAAIVEDETTIIIPASRRATMRVDGCIDVDVKESSEVK